MIFNFYLIPHLSITLIVNFFPSLASSVFIYFFCNNYPLPVLCCMPTLRFSFRAIFKSRHCHSCALWSSFANRGKRKTALLLRGLYKSEASAILWLVKIKDNLAKPIKVHDFNKISIIVQKNSFRTDVLYLHLRRISN